MEEIVRADTERGRREETRDGGKKRGGKRGEEGSGGG